MDHNKQLFVPAMWVALLLILLLAKPKKTFLRFDRVWDEADYVVPPAENGAFFITTNVLVTPNQTQSRCPENKKVNLTQITTHHTLNCKCLVIKLFLLYPLRLIFVRSHSLLSLMWSISFQ